MAESVPASKQHPTPEEGTSNQHEALPQVFNAQHAPGQQPASGPNESPCTAQRAQQAAQMPANVSQVAAAYAASTSQQPTQTAAQAPAAGQAGSAALPAPVLQALEIMVQAGADKQKALVALSSVPTAGKDIEG